MPNKHNTDRRHHIPKMKFKVQNWPEFEAGLRRRGSLTLWIEDAALAQWQSVGPRGQTRYHGVVIETCLMLRATFKMTLRQTEGLMASVLTLMNLEVSAPDHTTVSRRAVGLPIMKSAPAPNGPLHVVIDSTGLEVFSAGPWLEAKHGVKSRRTLRELHLAVDADSGMIVAQVLTDQLADDASQVGPLRRFCRDNATRRRSLRDRRRSECQRVELIGCGRGFVFGVCKLAFANHMHRFNTSDDDPGTAKGLESEHRSRYTFDGPVVLLDDVVEVL